MLRISKSHERLAYRGECIEKVSEVYWGPAFGGAIEGWFAYMAALVFLMFRPQGLFGEKIIERV